VNQGVARVSQLGTLLIRSMLRVGCRMYMTVLNYANLLSLDARTLKYERSPLHDSKIEIVVFDRREPFSKMY
jgi:hypothetical protein